MQQPQAATDPFLTFRNVKKTYDQKTLVVKDFNLEVKEGEFVTLLGPSGSGKTTVLMMLAGFENVTSGSISINGIPITATPPYKRNIGMVFQNYALFPHMTVAENLAYPLKVRKLPRAQIKQKVNEYLKLIEMEDFGSRHPGQLSGGQRQRVALARALIFEPALVLMDEPLGALDKKLREQMQFEITRLHQKLGFTVIYVTHDQVEALTMSNRIAVFNRGKVQQFAEPSALYERPANAFVASFIGENNLIPATIQSIDPNGMVHAKLANGNVISAVNGNCSDKDSTCIISVRPEKLRTAQLEGKEMPCLTTENRLPVTFVTRHYVGDFMRDFFSVPEGAVGTVDTGTTITTKTLNGLNAPSFRVGQTTELCWQQADCFAFQPDSSSLQGD
ncbi:ABC transporter ATP-binding protein [Neopusillimonas maritima]|uniref:Spermidine/putrescine import ATP-binding protein PotA n=1 Tax=Neopusillimonas maritima TaxID=2026239 RepID=A0A3A1YVJ5_9BURK|nr:ABC transporter ATP-binding protein [Neopusillimonas maritima]RIY40484.1 Fe3+/spermidine/putrescine ABC transporter ATP-binding protein [Neopusillimonas maritima]